MPKIILDGRRDVQDYIRLSGVFDSERLSHTPLLVFLASEEEVRVRTIDRACDLLSFPDDTPVMGQWRGEWRSDFFQFTVGDYRQDYDAKYSVFKSAQNVVKTVGPQGGFRSLTHEYDDANGVGRYASASSRSEADQLESLFAKYGIQIAVERQT